MVTHVNKALMTLYSLPSSLCRRHCLVPPRNPQVKWLDLCGSLPVRSLPRLGEAETCEPITLNEPRTLLHPALDLHRQADN